jgi:6-phosphogluconolactonase
LARELRIVEDIPEAAVEVFLEASPRTIALSGGATPQVTHERLARLDYPWEEVDVFFGDERCVPPDHPDSNYGMAQESLLSKVPVRVHPMTRSTSRSADLICDPDAYERELQSVFGPEMPRFDLIFLGIGDDGHTASLFPGDAALRVTDRWVTLVERPDHRRMTLTVPVLNAASIALFLVSGAGKREALRRLMEGADIPAARVQARRVIVIADPEAAR